MNSQLLAQDYELVPIDKLHKHPDNPRRGATEHIARSVATHGFYGAVVAQRSTGAILAGNHRWEVAKREKLEKIPVVWVDVDDRTAKSSSATTAFRISPGTLTTLWPRRFSICAHKIPWRVQLQRSRSGRSTQVYERHHTRSGEQSRS